MTAEPESANKRFSDPMKIRVAAPVRFAARPTSVIGLLGPRAADTLRSVGASDVPADRESHVIVSLAGTEARIVRAGDLPANGFALHVAPPGAEVMTFHQLCDRRLRAAGTRVDYGAADAFDAMARAFARLPVDEAARVDELVIDEGQDM